MSVEHADSRPSRLPVSTRVTLTDALGNRTSLRAAAIRPFEHEAPSFSFPSQVVCAQPAAPSGGSPPAASS